jgi:hypothetical protein
MYPSLVPAMTDREIIHRYQRLFDVSGDVTTSQMQWGFQCGPGWFGLLEQMCSRIQPLAQEGFALVCIKSKNATLRVHCRGGDDAVDAVIEATKAEALLIPQ